MPSSSPSIFSHVVPGLRWLNDGPPRYSEIRINLAQAFNAIGTVIAPVLGSYVLSQNVGDNGKSGFMTVGFYLNVVFLTLSNNK